jgi:hypothetical protein
MAADKPTTAQSQFLTYEQLRLAVEYWEAKGDEYHLAAANFLLDAANDWPTFDLKEPADLVAELHAAIAGPLTFDSLRLYAATADDAWKTEAVNALLELLELIQKKLRNATIDLEAAIEHLTTEYRTAASKTASEASISC